VSKSIIAVTVLPVSRASPLDLAVLLKSNTLTISVGN
jgi:hypothetical protein